ncbi:zinc knuckle CX2CX4HX4C containing protein [Tanacetum coccineum]
MKDNGVSGDETVDCKEDVMNSDIGGVAKVVGVVDDKDQSLNETKKNESVIEEDRTASRMEEIKDEVGNSSRQKVEKERDEMQFKGFGNSGVSVVVHGGESGGDMVVCGGLKGCLDHRILRSSPILPPLQSGLWIVDINVYLDKTDPIIIPLWVKICNVPLEACTVKGISTLASRVGKPLVMDNVTASMCRMGIGRVGFAMVLMEVNANKLLPAEIEISGRNKDGVRTEDSRQNDNEEKRKEENSSKSSNDGKADSEGFIQVQKRENGDVVGKVLNPNYKPNTQNPRFVNQKNNMNGKANVQYEFQPKKKVNNGNKEPVKPAKTTMNNSSGGETADNSPNKKD